jgi:hypothetical protein
VQADHALIKSSTKISHFRHFPHRTLICTRNNRHIRNQLKTLTGITHISAQTTFPQTLTSTHSRSVTDHALGARRAISKLTVAPPKSHENKNYHTLLDAPRLALQHGIFGFSILNSSLNPTGSLTFLQLTHQTL